jgi:flagellar motility protein MotE (MotC chaperone)
MDPMRLPLRATAFLRQAPLLLLLALAAPHAGAADDVAKTFAKAFAEGESADKKAALRAAAALPKEQDDLAFELLIKGVNDRQVHDEAVLALRARTGMQPTLNNRGTGYPGYPASDDASEWNNWLSARKKDLETQKKVAEQEKKLKALEEDRKKKEEKDKEKKDGAAKPGAEGTPAEGETAKGDGKGEPDKDGKEAPIKKPSTYEAPTDLGRPDRIVFKTGGSLVCYLISKRVNSDGVLQSVRVSHLNDGGEETLAADLIARIEEDIR